MSNKEVTQLRVKNVLQHVPTSAGKVAKVRNTMKRTASGMKTLLNQLSAGSTRELRERRKRRKIIIGVTIAAAALLLLILAIKIF